MLYFFLISCFFYDIIILSTYYCYLSEHSKEHFHEKNLSMTLLSNLVSDKRQQKNMTQQDLSLATGINRALISRLEKKDFVPSISQLENFGRGTWI